MMEQAPRRAFAGGLKKKGEAARIRESVAQALKESAIQNRPKQVEPIDYETYVVKNKVVLHNDPQRELVNFPHDDVEVPPPVLPKHTRTERSTVPQGAAKEASSLLVRECLKTYTGQCHTIKFKYQAYSGSYQQLPNVTQPSALPEHVFEIDDDSDEKDDDTLSRSFSTAITKKGWLFKGPDGHKENIISFTRQFKRRFFVLKQQTDSTYVLEFYKDEKKVEAKGSIFLDLAVDVVKNTKKGKLCFEVRMHENAPCLLAAESEADMEDWIHVLNKVISAAETASNISRDSMKEEVPAGKQEKYRESSVNHPVVKYSRETEYLLWKDRQENRQNLFRIYPEMRRHVMEEDEYEEDEGDGVDVFPAPYADRYVIEVKDFRVKLQVNLAEEEGPNKLCNPEPFFLTFALYDAKEGRKITEDFHFDPNEPEILGMIPHELQSPGDRQPRDGDAAAPDINGLGQTWLLSARKAMFAVVRRHQDIYLVVRIEKVLQGALAAAQEPYVKADPRAASKVHRQMKLQCSNIGHHRMPFAWSAKPLCTATIGVMELPIYRQDASRFTEDDIVKLLQDFRKPDKQSKLQLVPGHFQIKFQHLAPEEKIYNSLTTALVPVKPFPHPPTGSPTIEVAEFMPEDPSMCPTFDFYLNHLYVYPLSLKYDSQKSFPKARNIACRIEVRDSDLDSAAPLKCIYGRPGMSVFTTSASTTVLHHNTTPDFVEEVKLALPVQLTSRHHLLFKFYHVSCEASKSSRSSMSGLPGKKGNSIEMLVGMAWLPLLQDSRVVTGERAIPVACSLPQGYLQHDLPGSGKGSSSSDIKWVDNGKPLFRINIRLMSTIYTQDHHLHTFFQHCQKMESSPTTADLNIVNKLKSLLAVDVSTYIQFLPTLLNQLFHLLAKTESPDIATNTVRVLVHVVSEVHRVGRPELLEKYVKYVFRPDPIPKGSKQKTVHEELARNLTEFLTPARADPVVVRCFLHHADFFFQIIIKSMTFFLIDTDRVKMPRNERFSADCQFRLQSLVQILTPHILQKYKDFSNETRLANCSLANFVKTCFTLMDRGLVFRFIQYYMEKFSPSDAKELHDFKYVFLRVVCNHEQFIPLSLPLMRRGRIKSFKDFLRTCASFGSEDLKHDYTLSEEYRQTHYLSGLLLFELKLALGQPRESRRAAINVLRNQLAKHAFDDRYSSEAQQGRIAALYLPLVSLLLENKFRLMPGVQAPAPPPPAPTHTATPQPNGSAADLSSISRSQVSAAAASATSVQASSNPPTAGSGDKNGVERRDSMLLGMISGTVPLPQSASRLEIAKAQMNGSNGSINDSGKQDRENGKDKDTSDTASMKIHVRTASTVTQGTSSVSSPYLVRRHDKLDTMEIKDLLLCFLYVVKHAPNDILLGWFNNSSENDVVDFFHLMGLGLKYFKYEGRKKICTLSVIGDSKKAMTMPSAFINRRSMQGSSLSSQRAVSQYSDHDGFHTPTSSDAEGVMRAIMEANMATEVGLVVLDTLSHFCKTFQGELEARDGDNEQMHAVFHLYLSFLQTPQSETLQKHVFGAWRAFIKNFQKVLFTGSASFCGELCYEILRCCNSKLSSTRREGCALLYLLMRTNFEFCKKKSFTRVHLQVIISVSQLIGDVVGLSTTRFQESLAIVNNYANSDKTIQKTGFPGEVKDLTKRIRTVLMATAQMKENENDPELLIDLQYSLAKSYTSTPELRKTWLDSMARLHEKYGNHSEAAHCYIHIAALIAEYLKRRGSYPQGCQAFSALSPNIHMEESGIKDDTGMQDVQYTEETLVEFLEKAARHLELAERYEVLGALYRLIIPIYEKMRDFQRLAESYQRLTEAYNSLIKVIQSGRRLLGKYFRVAFFGQAHFEEEDGKEYIYKEPKVTSLPEICDRLMRQYTEKLGKETVQLIQDSKKVNPAGLDPKYAYIQVTFVTPYFEEREFQERLTDFERNNNIRRFMFETPFTKEGGARGSIDKQCMRRTILLTTHSFPYVKKRIQVMDRKESVLQPIEVAIDEMRKKVADLQEVVTSPIPDMKKLQLRLQGSVSTQVNAGPMAYADAFLSPDLSTQYPPPLVNKLKDVFKEFVNACNDALELNARLINTEQKEYHEALKLGFADIVERLSVMFGEKVIQLDWINNPHRYSLTLLNCNSGSSSA